MEHLVPVSQDEPLAPVSTHPDTRVEGEETQPFLHKKPNILNPSVTKHSPPEKRDEKPQWVHILLEGASRLLITVALCGGYILAMKIYGRQRS